MSLKVYAVLTLGQPSEALKRKYYLEHSYLKKILAAPGKCSDFEFSRSFDKFSFEKQRAALLWFVFGKAREDLKSEHFFGRLDFFNLIVL